MKKNFKHIIFISLLFMVGMSLLKAQTSLSISDKSTMSVSGTSSLHDWHSEVTSIKAKGAATIADGNLVSVESLIINVPVTSIKSGKKGMDNNTYDALKSDEHPTIKFQVSSADIAGNTITARGKLEVAGVVRTISLTSTYKISGDQLEVKGEYVIDMNDFEIDPPTALMGTVTTGKDVTIHYQIIFNF